MTPIAWQPDGTDERGRFNDLTPIEILDWFDGPRLFTFVDEQILYLAYACSEGDRTIRYIITPTEQDRIRALERGHISLLDAIKAPIVWVIDISEGQTFAIKRLAWAAIPSTVVPCPHVLLNPGLAPIFQLYVQGDTLFYELTAGQLGKYVESSYALLRRFFQSVDWAGGFDPPIHQVSVSSLRLSFGTPGIGKFDQRKAELTEQFRDRIGENGDPTMIDAIVRICPFQNTGPADSVTLSGQLVPGTPIILHRGDRAIWRDKLRRIQQQRIARRREMEGRVEEIDWGRWTFTLRDLNIELREQPCRADETIVNELRELYGDNSQTRIRVFGNSIQGDQYLEVDRYEVVTPSSLSPPSGTDE